ncbi:MAG TPA: FkbM family methyltransferase [Actinomycetota bacterium]|nr:FkbM family methyltransferase [Actinomycetota bacterium]
MDRSSPSQAPSSSATSSGPGVAHRIFIRAAQLVPLRWQRTLRSGPLGGFLRFALDRVAPAGRREVLQVRDGLLKGALLDVDVRKQRDMIAGTYESEVQRLLSEHVRPGQVAFDVGAHLGFFTLLLARLVGDGGRVVSVEPDPFLGPKLQANLEKNDASNVTVVRAAAGTVAAERRFVSGGGGGIGHLGDEGDLQVDGTTLDDLARRFGTPDLVKIDVEGGEVEVLRGAPELLSTGRPVVVVEVHDSAMEAEARQLLDEMSYDVSAITDDPSSRRHLVAVPLAS